MKVDFEFINLIQHNYPKAWEWVRSKARWEHITLGEVVDTYRDYINKLIEEEKGE